MGTVRFQKRLLASFVNDAPPNDFNVMMTAGDVNADGQIDIVVAGRFGEIAWFENPNGSKEWTRHPIGHVHSIDAGGVMTDLTGNGYPDLIVGGDWKCNELAWWENPGPDFDRPWTRRVLFHSPAPKFHDQAIGDVTGDGRRSLVFWNQKHDASLMWVPLPTDPRQIPWPDIRVITSGRRHRMPEEGIAIADLDGDGQNEIIAGTWWYKFVGGTNEWEAHRFADDYMTTRIAVADLDHDGQLEIVLAEGDPCIYAKPEGGKIAWFKPGDRLTDLWAEHLLDDYLLDAHTLDVGDICGNGHADLLVGECGVVEPFGKRLPRIFVCENDGRGHFTRHLIDEGTGIHEGRLLVTRPSGQLDIVGKPIFGPEKWDLHVYENLCRGSL